METIKIYIAGKVSGEPYLTSLAKFNKYEHFYKKQNIVVENPMLFCNPSWSWLRCMMKCIWRLAKCQKVHFIADWTQSRGARVEMVAALVLGKKIKLTPVLP